MIGCVRLGLVLSCRVGLGSGRVVSGRVKLGQKWSGPGSYSIVWVGGGPIGNGWVGSGWVLVVVRPGRSVPAVIRLAVVTSAVGWVGLAQVGQSCGRVRLGRAVIRLIGLCLAEF